MCMGYAKEIKAWVCQTEQNQRDEAMVAWGEAFTQDPANEKVSAISSITRALDCGILPASHQADLQLASKG